MSDPQEPVHPAPGQVVVQCKGCKRTAVVPPEGGNVHELLVCRCCPADHHHGEATAATGDPCRPVDVFVWVGVRQVA